MSSIARGKNLPTHEEESHEYVWKIPEHVSVISSVSTIRSAMQEFSVTSAKSGVVYKFEVGYKMVDDENFTPYLKLLSSSDAAGGGSQMKWSLWFKDAGRNEWTLRASYKMDASVPLRSGLDLTLPNLQKWGLNSSFLLGSEGTMWWKVHLEIWKRSPVQQFQMESMANLKSHLGLLLNDAKSSGSTADLKIICSDRVTLNAHRVILAARNPVFGGMMTAEMVEQTTGILRVEDVSSATMLILLHFLYTGDLQEGWHTKDSVLEFVYAAGKYQITELLKLLDAEVGTKEYGDETLQLLDLVNKLGLKKAEGRLLDRVKKMVSSVNAAEQLFQVLESFTEMKQVQQTKKRRIIK